MEAYKRWRVGTGYEQEQVGFYIADDNGSVLLSPDIYPDRGIISLIESSPELLEATEWALGKMIDDTVRLDPHGRSIEQIEKDGMLPAQIYKARDAIAKALRS